MTFDRPAIFRLTQQHRTKLDWLALLSDRTSSEWIRDIIDREAASIVDSRKVTSNDD